VATPSTVEVDGRQLTLTNLEKVLYPATGFTKAAVVDYYVRIAPVLVPHLRRRALTMRFLRARFARHPASSAHHGGR